MKKRFAAFLMAGILCCSVNAYAFEVANNPTQVNLVERIRAAGQVEKTQTEAKPDLSERIKMIVEDSQPTQSGTINQLPKVAVMYVNNAKATYDDAIDDEVFKYLNSALPKSEYELVDGAPYIEKLNKMGYMDISSAERSDVADAFAGENIDYCVYLEIDPFIARDKTTFFTIGKDITTAISVKIVSLGTGKYIYTGKFTEKASDSSMIGLVGNKSVAMKALDNACEKIVGIINVRLPKTKSIPAGES
jgi:hypothetical protein